MFWLQVQENLILMKETSKKCSTDRKFILKEITKSILSWKSSFFHNIISLSDLLKLSTRLQNSHFQTQFFMPKIIQIFIKKIIEHYLFFSGTFFIIGIFWNFNFLWCTLFSKMCPIFVGSIANFGSSSSFLSIAIQLIIFHLRIWN